MSRSIILGMQNDNSTYPRLPVYVAILVLEPTVKAVHVHGVLGPQQLHHVAEEGQARRLRYLTVGRCRRWQRFRERRWFRLRGPGGKEWR